MSLLSEKSEQYLVDCIEKNIEPERAKLVGMSKEEILNYFYKNEVISKTEKGWISKFNPTKYKNQKLKFDLINADDGLVVASTNDKVTPRSLIKLSEDGLENIFIQEDELLGSYLAEDIINEQTGEVLYEAGDKLDSESLNLLTEIKFHLINNLLLIVGPKKCLVMNITKM